MESNRIDNPFHPPQQQQIANDRSQPNGLLALVVGTAISFGSIILILYLMIAVIPELKDQFDDRNLQLGPWLNSTIHVVDFFFKYWFVFFIIYLALVCCNEFLTPIESKSQFRRRLGISVGLAAILSAAWLFWMTLIAAA